MRNGRKTAALLLSLLLLLPFFACREAAFAGITSYVPPESSAENVRIIVVTDYNPHPASVLKASTRRAAKSAESFLSLMESSEEDEIVEEYSEIFTGFAIDTTEDRLEEIRALPGVKAAYIERCFILFDEEEAYSEANYEALSAGDHLTLIGADKDNGGISLGEDTSYSGKGKAIAILDTGLYFEGNSEQSNATVHEAFRGEVAEPKFTEESIIPSTDSDKLHAVIRTGQSPYISSKIPYVYNYGDKNLDVNDGNSHGTHVAGIAAANAGSIRGVAPAAQLLIMKVIDEGGYIKESYIYNALEDALILGADVINISIGTPAGFDDVNMNAIDASSKVFENAYNNIVSRGTALYVAAGNSYTQTYFRNNLNNTDLPSSRLSHVENPDFSVVAEPSTYSAPISVASCSVPSSLLAVRPSAFSSWGPGMSLSIKPEISAPGGSIYSAINGKGSYATKSGTSMSSPVMAGVEALMREYLEDNENTEGLTAAEESVRSAQLLMSTAYIINGDNSLYVSPRKQGAGLVRLTSAMSTKAYLSCDSAPYNRPKAELGSSEEGSFSFSFKLHSLLSGSDEAAAERYRINLVVLTESVTTSSGVKYISEESRELIAGTDFDLSISVDGESASEVTLAPGGSKEVSVSLALSESGREKLDADFPNGIYIEGFAVLRPDSSEQPELSLPFLGFYGDWDSLPLFDGSWYEDKKLSLFKGYVGYTLESGLGSLILGTREVEDSSELIDTARFAVQGGNSGRRLFFRYGLLRNADSIGVLIKDPSGETVYERSDSNAEKTYVYASNSSYLIDRYNTDKWAWIPYSENSADTDSALPDGEYSIMLYATHGEYREEKTFKLCVDSEEPVLSSAVYDSGLLSIKLKDNHYIQAVALASNAEGENLMLTEWECPDISEAGEEVSLSFDLDAYNESHQDAAINLVSGSVSIIALDYAGNKLVSKDILLGSMEGVDQTADYVVKSESSGSGSASFTVNASHPLEIIIASYKDGMFKGLKTERIQKGLENRSFLTEDGMTYKVFLVEYETPGFEPLSDSLEW